MPAAVLRPVVAVGDLEDLLDLLVDDPVAAAVDEVEELDEVADAAGVGAVGLKVVCPMPNPIAAASVPVPETVT